MYCAWILRLPKCTMYGIISTLYTYYKTSHEFPEGFSKLFESRWDAEKYIQTNLTDVELLLGSGFSDASELRLNVIYTADF